MPDVATSYRDRFGGDSDRGAAIQVAISPSEMRSPGNRDLTKAVADGGKRITTIEGALA